MKVITLRDGKERSLERRHPWVFESSIASGKADAGETVRVHPGEYSFGDGQFWWDADVAAAAECMLRCVEDEAERDRRAANGKAYIIEHYAPAAVGRNYVERLRTLGLLE